MRHTANCHNADIFHLSAVVANMSDDLRHSLESDVKNISTPVRLALIGAGARGELNLATLVKKHPDLMKITAVAEMDDLRRELFCKKFGIEKQNAFRDWRELFEKPGAADAVVNALPCRMHYESSLAALKSGCHVFLEKPMALDPAQAVHLARTAEKNDLLLFVSLQSRYNDIYTRMRREFDAGKIGRLMNIDCAENVGYWHFIMSYVRGIHHRADLSHSFVMAKGVHDLDLVSWFAGADAKRVASFGGLGFFNAENAPEGAPERCTDGCPVGDACEFSAIKQFVKPGMPDIPLAMFSGMSARAIFDVAMNPRFRTLASVIARDIGKENVMRLLRETEHGKCVFRADNDVVDHQTVSIEFENGVVASFQISAFSLIWERTLNLHGTKGEIRSADFTGRLETRTYNPGRVDRRRVRYHGIIHGGGDEMILVDFAQALRDGRKDESLAGARSALESHFICFAAEEARKKNKVVDMDKFRRAAEKDADALDSNEFPVF